MDLHLGLNCIISKLFDIPLVEWEHTISSSYLSRNEEERQITVAKIFIDETTRQERIQIPAKIHENVFVLEL